MPAEKKAALKGVFSVVVLMGWAFNLVAPAFLSSYDSNLAANAPLMLILGAMYATRKKEKAEE